MDAPGENLEASPARLKNFLDEKHPDNLIIDVRHNNGGNLQLLPPLLRTVSNLKEASPTRAFTSSAAGPPTPPARSSSRKWKC